MIRAYRICRAKFAGSAFSGEGAWRNGGRWNEKGTRLVYCSSSISLAILEVLVNTPQLPLDMVAILVELADDVALDAWTSQDLPADWAESPAPSAIKSRGSAWVAENRALALRVPSAVVPGETNLLINPAHRDLARCQFGAPQPILFDPRLKP